MKTSQIILSTITVAGMLIVGAATVANAHDGRGFEQGRGGFGRHGLPGPEFAERIVRGLDLEGDQREAVRAVIDAARPEFRALIDAMHDRRQEIHALAESDSPDAAALRNAADNTGDLVAEMIVLGVGVMNDVRVLLTPEQLEELESRIGERGGRRFGHRR